MMFARGGADPALPVGGGLMSEPQDAASESLSEVEADEVVVVLAAHDGAPCAVLYEHDGGGAHLVVVVRHRVAVRAGDRRGEDVAYGDVGRQRSVADQHVAGLAVLTHDVGNE